MRKIVLFLFFAHLACISLVFSEEIEIDSEVMNIDPALECIIIRHGEDRSIEVGDGLIVHRDKQKIAEAYIIEVRQEISAAEILNVEKGEEILKGDNVLMVKEVKEAKPHRKKPKSSGIEITSGKKPKYTTKDKTTKRGDVISVDIARDPKTVFAYASMVLRKNGFSITSTDRTRGILLASRPIQLSIIKELWADALAAIDHNLVVLLDIKDEGASSKLIAVSFKEHSQKERHVKRAVIKNSEYYNEIVTLVREIKKRSEY